MTVVDAAYNACKRNGSVKTYEQFQKEIICLRENQLSCMFESKKEFPFVVIGNEVKYGFDAFMQTLPLKNQNIDFVGIDLDKDNIVFKVYLGITPMEFDNDKILKLSPSGFLKRFFEKDMIYRLEVVQDTRSTWRGRYDIALDNRTNENMDWLFEQIVEEVPFIAKHKMLLQNMSNMKIAEHPNYRCAALYHIGVQEKDGRIQALKFYFTARYQNVPKFTTKKLEYRDTEYLAYFENCEPVFFSKLRNIVEDMLIQCGGHLWMAALDISQNGISKYKIYIKNANRMYKYLKTVFGGIYRKKIEQLEIWNQRNLYFRLDGLAIGIDESETFSLNLYFTIP